MERSHLKQHHQHQQQNNVVSSRLVKENNKNLKERWECRNHDQMNGMFSWPPRSYTCSFCKREFRSAQALGGHMNVHRRDRARLRQLSPPPPPPPPPPTSRSDPFIINLNINPNPNLDHHHSPDHPTTTISSLSSPATSHEIMKWSSANYSDNYNYKPKGGKGINNLAKPLYRPRTNHHQDLDEKDDQKIIMTLDLKIGLVRESEDDDLDHHHQEDLDLELRLGYAHHE